MNVLKPVSRTTLSEQVALQIISMISAGKWEPGDKLLPETLRTAQHACVAARRLFHERMVLANYEN
jgi:DNA-binding GntR family transcriptional regulator